MPELPHAARPHPRLLPQLQRHRTESPLGHGQRQEILVEPPDHAGIDGARREMIAVRADQQHPPLGIADDRGETRAVARDLNPRSEEHTSEIQSLMRTSYAVFCLKKK